MNAARVPRLATGRWQTFDSDWGVPVRITVGRPKVPFAFAELRLAAPWELIRRGQWLDLPVEQERRIYETRLAVHGPRILERIADLADSYPNQLLVFMCFEDVLAGEECHRRWLAAWLEDQLGVPIPELAEGGGSSG